MKKSDLEDAIQMYDDNKGPRKRIFGDSPEIQQLREILDFPEVVELNPNSDLPDNAIDEIRQIYSSLNRNESLTFQVLDRLNSIIEQQQNEYKVAVDPNLENLARHFDHWMGSTTGHNGTNNEELVDWLYFDNGGEHIENYGQFIELAMLLSEEYGYNTNPPPTEREFDEGIREYLHRNLGRNQEFVHREEKFFIEPQRRHGIDEVSDKFDHWMNAYNHHGETNHNILLARWLSAGPGAQYIEDYAGFCEIANFLHQEYGYNTSPPPSEEEFNEGARRYREDIEDFRRVDNHQEEKMFPILDERIETDDLADRFDYWMRHYNHPVVEDNNHLVTWLFADNGGEHIENYDQFIELATLLSEDYGYNTNPPPIEREFDEGMMEYRRRAQRRNVDEEKEINQNLPPILQILMPFFQAGRADVALDILGGLGNLGEQNLDEVNISKSTHTASVHESASETASRLRGLYQNQISSEADLEGVWHDIRRWAEGRLGGADYNQAVIEAVNNIIEQRDHTDPKSGVTLRQLFALAWVAMHDDSYREGELSDALDMFAEGLYEIQRGYNLDSQGIDRGGLASSICSPGAFNKLVEKLSGIISIAEMNYVTMETFSLKLQAVVREEASLYLQSLQKDFEEKSDLSEFENIVRVVNENGITHPLNGGVSIWGSIRSRVDERMFEEFGEFLFNNDPEHPRLRGAIEVAGEVIEFNYSLEQPSQPINLETAQIALDHIQERLRIAWIMLANSDQNVLTHHLLIIVGSLYDMLLVPEISNPVALLDQFNQQLQSYASGNSENGSGAEEEKVANIDELNSIFSEINTILRDPEGYVSSIRSQAELVRDVRLSQFGHFSSDNRNPPASNDESLEDSDKHKRAKQK